MFTLILRRCRAAAISRFFYAKSLLALLHTPRLIMLLMPLPQRWFRCRHIRYYAFRYAMLHASRERRKRVCCFAALSLEAPYTGCYHTIYRCYARNIHSIRGRSHGARCLFTMRYARQIPYHYARRTACFVGEQQSLRGDAAGCRYVPDYATVAAL